MSFQGHHHRSIFHHSLWQAATLKLKNCFNREKKTPNTKTLQTNKQTNPLQTNKHQNQQTKITKQNSPNIGLSKSLRLSKQICVNYSMNSVVKAITELLRTMNISTAIMFYTNCACKEKEIISHPKAAIFRDLIEEDWATLSLSLPSTQSEEFPMHPYREWQNFWHLLFLSCSGGLPGTGRFLISCTLWLKLSLSPNAVSARFKLTLILWHR